MGSTPCCCGNPCVDATTLPVTLTAGSGAYAVSVAAAEWSNVLNAGVLLPCCWGVQKQFGTFPFFFPEYNGYEYKCSSAYGFSGSADKILVSIRWKAYTSFALTKQTCKCDAQPTAVSQYVLTARETYAIWAGVYVNFGTCALFAYDLSLSRTSRPSNFLSTTQTIVRRTYFTSAITASYLLTPTSLAVCDDTCPDESFAENSLTVTSTVSGVSRSITWDDTSDWTINLTY